MKITDRFKLAVKAFNLDSNLGNSMGTVLRNYAKPAEFRPHQQLQGITYKAIEKISLAVSGYEPKVVRKNGDVYENHPLYNLFNKPNPRQNATDFLTLWSFFYEIYGETFWYKARGESSGKVKELYLLNPAQMELIIDEGELIGYKYHKSAGAQVPFEVDEIIHDKRPNPFNEWRGMSVMERASTYIDTEITTSSFTLNYMKNNASPSGIVSLPNMTKETFQQFASQWREGYEGPDNAGKTAFIRGEGVEFKAVGATLKDVDQEITRKMSKEDVLMMFDVPKGLLGVADSKGLGVSDLEPLEYIFAKYNTEPRMKRLDRIYETMLTEQKIIGEQVKDVTHETPIPDDKRFKLETHTAGVNVWMTINEVREQQGLEPIPGGDELKENQPITLQASKKVVLKKKEAEPTEAEIAEGFRSRGEKINEIYAIKLKRAISKFASGQEKKVISSINAKSKAFEEWLFNLRAESEAMAAILEPLLLELIAEQAKNATNFISGQEFVFGPREREMVSQNIKTISGIYNQKTYEALEATITEGMANGESLVKIKERVEDAYKGPKGPQAELVARTESSRTGNLTVEQVYKQNGYTSKIWFSNPGACEFCQAMDGKVVAIGKDYNQVGDVVEGNDGGFMALNYTNVGTPPLHPNCLCSLIPSYD